MEPNPECAQEEAEEDGDTPETQEKPKTLCLLYIKRVNPHNGLVDKLGSRQFFSRVHSAKRKLSTKQVKGVVRHIRIGETGRTLETRSKEHKYAVFWTATPVAVGTIPN